MKRRKVLSAVLTILALVIFFAGIWLYGGSVVKTPLQADDNMTFVRGEVTEILKGNSGNGENDASGMAGSQDVKVRILSGENKGKIVEADNLNGYLYGANCQVGTRVILQLSQYGDTLSANVYGYDRGIQIYVLMGLFILLLCLIGGKRGLYSTIALIFTFVCLIGMYLPMLYQGCDVFWSTILTVCVISVVSLLLIAGYTKKTACALAGTIAGVAISGIVAMVFGNWAHISGFNMEDVESMIYVSQNSKLQVGDLLYAGILIASLGAVMDVAMSVTSTITEIRDKTPSLTKKELFCSGVHVGRDMMGTMSNTLILAFAGSSLNTMILIYAYNFPYQQILNMYSIGIEILRGVSGTIGIIMTVPLVSFITAMWGPGSRKVKIQLPEKTDALREESVENVM